VGMCVHSVVDEEGPITAVSPLGLVNT
jgi:hypothetical protein